MCPATADNKCALEKLDKPLHALCCPGPISAGLNEVAGLKRLMLSVGLFLQRLSNCMMWIWSLSPSVQVWGRKKKKTLKSCFQINIYQFWKSISLHFGGQGGLSHSKMTLYQTWKYVLPFWQKSQPGNSRDKAQRCNTTWEWNWEENNQVSTSPGRYSTVRPLKELCVHLRVNAFLLFLRRRKIVKLSCVAVQMVGGVWQWWGAESEQDF